jgi:hypothetical protein
MNDANFHSLRTAEEIARRSLALHSAIAAAHGVSKTELIKWLKQEKLWDELTPRELAFITQDENRRKAVVWMTWFIEAQVTLLWSIQKLDELPPPVEKCDPASIIAAMPSLFGATSPFVESAVLRSAEEIKYAEESIYNIHCDINQAVRKGEKIPRDYDKDVVFFRHYGLSWISGYCEQSWDEITPDT